MKVTIVLCLCLVIGLSVLQDVSAWPAPKSVELGISWKKRSDGDFFAEIDTNGDELIDLGEYENAEPTGFDEMAGEMEFADILMHCDADGDQNLNREEFANVPNCLKVY